MTNFGIQEALEKLGVKEVNEGSSTGLKWFSSGDLIESYSPVDGKLIGKVKTTTNKDYESVMTAATMAFKSWRLVPAPQRGEIVRQFGEKITRIERASWKIGFLRNGKKLPRRFG